jgi:hypothetical protein
MLVNTAGGNQFDGIVSIDGDSSKLDITAQTLVKGAPGRIMRVSVVVAGTAAGTVNDAATTGAASASNAVATIPNAIGVTALNFPCFNGIVVTPGAGQTLSVSYL